MAKKNFLWQKPITKNLADARIFRTYVSTICFSFFLFIFPPRKLYFINIFGRTVRSQPKTAVHRCFRTIVSSIHYCIYASPRYPFGVLCESKTYYSYSYVCIYTLYVHILHTRNIHIHWNIYIYISTARLHTHSHIHTQNHSSIFKNDLPRRLPRHPSAC